MADLPLDEASVEVVRRKDVVTERCLWQDFNMETVLDEVRVRACSTWSMLLWSSSSNSSYN